MINIRPASKEDALKFYDSLDKSMRAWVVEDKEILAIGGFAFHPYGIFFFSKKSKECPAKSFWKACKIGLNEGLKYNMPIWAMREKELESSARFLTKLGFKFSHINTDNEEIYLWHKH